MYDLVGNRSLNASALDKESPGEVNTTWEKGETYDPTTPQCKDISPYLLKGDGWIPQYIVYTYPMVYPYLCIYMFFVFIVSVTGNTMVMVTFWKIKSLRVPLNYAIISLAIADLACGAIGGFLSVLANGARYFFMGKVMCQVEGYTLSFFGCAGLNTVAVMAIERYVVVCKPHLKTFINKRNALYVLAIAWIYSLIWNTPPLIFWDGYTVEGVGTSCAPNWYVTEPGQRAFIIAYFFGGFLIPYAMIIYCYGTLIWTLKQVSKESSVSGKKNPEKEVTKMVMVMVAAFSFGWFPYAIFAMYNACNPENPISPGVSALAVFFAKAAACYNPLIYLGLNRQFREGLFRVIFGFNPWSEEVGLSTVSSQGSVMTTISKQ